MQIEFPRSLFKRPQVPEHGFDSKWGSSGEELVQVPTQKTFWRSPAALITRFCQIILIMSITVVVIFFFFWLTTQ